MTMIEVDPKLFITCRLCLDDLGMYQIVPSVQEQIKFCFDIDVQQFDGLPQLICKKCEEILSDFYMKKKVFKEKQDNLLEQLQVNKPKGNKLDSVFKQFEVEEAVTSSQINEENTEDNVINYSTPVSKPVTTYKNKSNKWWIEAGFSKEYQCRLCIKKFTTKASIVNHIKSHGKIINKYKNVYSKWCQVSIEKFDDKPNKTGSCKTVVWDDHTVLQNVLNKNYYIKYSSNQTPDTNNLNNSNSDEEFYVKGNNSKRRRIQSRDSTDTVVLDSNLNKSNNLVKELESNKIDTAQVDTECISIADSSDNESVGTPVSNGKDESQFQVPDYNTIQSIISGCHQKYLKKVTQGDDSSAKKKNPANVENLLKHKILSIGRKIINKQGFNCNGILRFMEYKNLDIEWKPVKTSQEKNIRILTKHKESKKNIPVGWKKMVKFLEEQKHAVPLCLKVEDIKTDNSLFSHNHVHPNDIQNDQASNLPKPQDSAVLYVDLASQKESDKKILNENPVANPKQLPKKISEPKGKSNYQHFIEVPVYNANDTVGNPDPNNDTDTLFPIITSTTSLAQITLEDDPKKDHPQTPVTMQPRIKVKPPSELMAPKPNNTNFGINYSNVPIRVTGTIPQYLIEVHNKAPQQATPQTSQLTGDVIMLHTVELPHCKTDSPFRYFQSLLQMHFITLLDCNATLNADYNCLIKFKVHYAEGVKDRPIVLCSSLMYFNNNFCIKIRDAKQLEINITKLSANWQWEILKTFKSDVAPKMSENALKFGRDVFVKTNDFIRCLKSIEMQKINQY